MTGPEHYREAEKLLNHAELTDDVYDTDPVSVALVAAAQAHATLAQAAAEVLRTVGEWFEIEQEAEEWCHAIQVKREAAK